MAIKNLANYEKKYSGGGVDSSGWNCTLFSVLYDKKFKFWQLKMTKSFDKQVNIFNEKLSLSSKDSFSLFGKSWLWPWLDSPSASIDK